MLQKGLLSNINTEGVMKHVGIYLPCNIQTGRYDPVIYINIKHLYKILIGSYGWGISGVFTGASYYTHILFAY